MTLTKSLLKRITAGFIFVFSFIIYIITLAPTIISRDSAELIAAAYKLDIAHPPAYPLYIILGKIFSVIPIGIVSYRINLMTALFGALTVFVLFWILLKLVRNITAATVASLCFAFSGLFWFWTTSAEVFSLLTLLAAILIYILISWKEKIKFQKVNDFRLLIIFSFIFGLSLGNHHIIILLIPAFLYFIFSTDKKIIDVKKIGLCLLSFILGVFLMYFFVFIRSKADLYIDWGNPETFGNLMNVFLRREFGTVFLNEFHNIGWNFKTFFSHLSFNISQLSAQFTFFGIIIAIAGMYYLYKNNKQILIFTALAYLFSSLTISLLMGNMQANPNILFVSERFYILSFFIFTIFLAAGLKFIIQKTKVHNNIVYFIITFAIILGLLPINNVISNYKANDKSNEYMDNDKIVNILNSVEENAIIITTDDNIEFGIWYYQMVENTRKDIKVVLPSSSDLKNQDTRERYPEIFSNPTPLADHFIINLINYYMPDTSGRKIILDTISNNIENYPVYLIELNDIEMLLGDYLVTNGLLRKISLDVNPNTYQLKSVSHQNLWENYQYNNPLYLSNKTHHLHAEIITQYLTAHNFLALLYISQGDYQEAAKELARSLAIHPANKTASQLDDLLINIQKKESIKDKLEVAEFHFDLGLLYLNAKRYDQAAQEFETAINLGLDTDISNLNLGIAYLKQENISKAKKFIEKSLEINPDNITAVDFLNFINTF